MPLLVRCLQKLVDLKLGTSCIEHSGSLEVRWPIQDQFSHNIRAIQSGELMKYACKIAAYLIKGWGRPRCLWLGYMRSTTLTSTFT
jgi:hypothetical protein